MTNDQLIAGCINQDRKAQQLLYDQYSGQMYSICLRYCKDAPTAADSLQTAFLKVYNNISKFNHTGNIAAWIRRIVVNSCLDRINFDKRSFTVDISDTEQEFAYDQELKFDDYNYQRLLILLGEMPEGYRIVFSMYVLDDMSHAEIAETLGITASTSRSQLLKARKQMQKLIKEDKYLSLQYIKK